MANAKVELRGQNFQLETRSSAVGKFDLRYIPEGEYVLVSTSPGFYPTLVNIRLSSGQDLRLGEVQMLVVGLQMMDYPLTFRRLPGQETGNLLLRVLADDDTPLEDVQVTLTCSKPGCGTLKTSVDGEVRFRGVDPVASTLEVTAPGFYKEILDIRIVKGVELEYRFVRLFRCRDAACSPPKFEGIWLE